MTIDTEALLKIVEFGEARCREQEQELPTMWHHTGWRPLVYQLVQAVRDLMAAEAEMRTAYAICAGQHGAALEQLADLTSVHEAHLAFYNVTVEQRNHAWRQIEDLERAVSTWEGK